MRQQLLHISGLCCLGCMLCLYGLYNKTTVQHICQNLHLKSLSLLKNCARNFLTITLWSTLLHRSFLIFTKKSNNLEFRHSPNFLGSLGEQVTVFPPLILAQELWSQSHAKCIIWCFDEVLHFLLPHHMALWFTSAELSCSKGIWDY